MILSKQVSSLLSVVECGSFQKAAKRMYVSTSALVQQVNLLEKEVGVPLLYRSWKVVEPTEAGKLFCERMKRILNETEETLADVRALINVPSLAINIAYAQTLQQRYIYGIYRLYLQRNLGPMTITPADYSTILDHVVDEKYDGCFIQSCSRVRKCGLTTVQLWDERPTLALPKTHPLAAKERILLSDLKNCTIVLPEYGMYDSTDTFLDELRKSDIPTTIVHINALMQSEIYCREHSAVRLCLRRTLDPDMVMIPIETEALFGICLAYKSEPVYLQKLSHLIELVNEFHNMDADKVISAVETGLSPK